MRNNLSFDAVCNQLVNQQPNLQPFIPFIRIAPEKMQEKDVDFLSKNFDLLIDTYPSCLPDLARQDHMMVFGLVSRATAMFNKCIESNPELSEDVTIFIGNLVPTMKVIAQNLQASGFSISTQLGFPPSIALELTFDV